MAFFAIYDEVLRGEDASLDWIRAPAARGVRSAALILGYWCRRLAKGKRNAG